MPKQKVLAHLKYQIESFEKIPIRIWPHSTDASAYMAGEIATAIRLSQSKSKPFVLGLATGSSPIHLYQELIRLHKQENLSFHNVHTFNLDEYYPMLPDASQSYVRFMKEQLFDHVDIPSDQIHIPDGTLALEEIEDYCMEYEQKIEALGGLDIQILGIGRTGHVGFNEPGSDLLSKTRLVRLDSITLQDAKDDFIDAESTPYRAITMGIETIMKAGRIFIMAWGQHKAEVIQKATEGMITSQVPSTFLQKHPNTEFHIDLPASERLTKIAQPWLVGMCDWTDDLICRAVVWLSLKIDKPILKLTDEDYNEHGLGELLIQYESGYDINIMIFNRLQHTITGWPGGKPETDDSTRPERATPAKKRVILFSPHPDDDVISMGGTFARLVQQGHDVHVVYQTSGNIAVHDHDALRYLEFYKEFSEQGRRKSASNKLMTELLEELESKNSLTSQNMRIVKGLIRRGEARAGARFSGLSDDHIHFLDLPFYETGKKRKSPLGERDIQLTYDIISEIKPHQIFSAGDLADPHGTHRVCLNVILEALQKCKTESWIKNCWLWLYRGAWHEFSIDEIEMAVPLSPGELLRKKKAIFMHQSQKDNPPFPGEDDREFWQRAEDRNRQTAEQYAKLGLAQYEAMEAFKRFIF